MKKNVRSRLGTRGGDHFCGDSRTAASVRITGSRGSGKLPHLRYGWAARSGQSALTGGKFDWSGTSPDSPCSGAGTGRRMLERIIRGRAVACGKRLAASVAQEAALLCVHVRRFPAEKPQTAPKNFPRDVRLVKDWKSLLSRSGRWRSDARLLTRYPRQWSAMDPAEDAYRSVQDDECSELRSCWSCSEILSACDRTGDWKRLRRLRCKRFPSAVMPGGLKIIWPSKVGPRFGRRARAVRSDVNLPLSINFVSD